MSGFRFAVGQSYQTKAGQYVTVIGRTDLTGYECIECSDGRYRYDRSTEGSDAGRVTGTAHNYCYAHNLRREQA